MDQSPGNKETVMAPVPLTPGGLRKQLVGLLVLVLFVRIGAGFAGWNSLHEDPDAYARLAISLADYGVFGFASDVEPPPTAFRPPLYPWLLSWLVSDSKLPPMNVFLLHTGFSILIAWLVCLVARRLGLQRPAVVSLLVTIDPLLIRAGQQVMTELLTTLLVALAWWMWLVVWPKRATGESDCPTTKRSPGQWIALYGLGIVFGLTVLVRPTAAPWTALCLAGLFWFGCRCWKRRLVDALVISTGVALCVLPWTLRNLSAFGQPIWATTHGGYTMLLANNPSLYAHFIRQGASRNWKADAFHSAWAERGAVDRSQLLDQSFWLSARDDVPLTNQTDHPTVHSLGELADDRLAYELAVLTIRNDPQTFAASCVYRLCWLWAWWPSGSGTMATLAIGSWYGALFFLALRGLCRLCCSRGKWGNIAIKPLAHEVGNWLPGLALLTALCAVHCVYWSNMRMRSPAMPCIYLLTFLALAKNDET